MKVLLIIPAYNEEKNIEKTVDFVNTYLKKNKEYEIDYIVINDGSTDKTREICEKKGIKCINLIHNLGIGGAVQTGYIFAKEKGYDIAVQFDGDGQHDINSLNKLLAPIVSGEADFVVGSRFIDNSSEFQSTTIRRVGIKYLSKLVSFFVKNKLTDPTSGYRAANKNVIRLFSEQYPVDYPEPESLVILSKNDFKIVEKQVNMFERSGGVSSINIWKSFYYMFKVTIAIICVGMRKRKCWRLESCQ